MVEASRSELLWQVVCGAYRELGFDALADEVFESLVAARVIEPTSKADTLYNCLARCLERDYRSQPG